MELCPGCSRHVRDVVCPFCDAAIAPSGPPPSHPRRAMRRVLLASAGGAFVAATMGLLSGETACVVFAYGGAPFLDDGGDASVVDAATADASVDAAGDASVVDAATADASLDAAIDDGAADAADADPGDR